MRISDWSSDVCSSDLLEAEGAGMREAVIARRRRSPAVDQDQGAAGLQALKAAGRGALQRPLAAGGALQDQADLQILALVAAVEQCKAAVAVLQQAQHRGHALDPEAEEIGRAHV